MLQPRRLYLIWFYDATSIAPSDPREGRLTDGQANQPRAGQLPGRTTARRDRRLVVAAGRAGCFRRAATLRRVPEEPRPGQEHPVLAAAQPGRARHPRDG